MQNLFVTNLIFLELRRTMEFWSVIRLLPLVIFKIIFNVLLPIVDVASDIYFTIDVYNKEDMKYFIASGIEHASYLKITTIPLINFKDSSSYLLISLNIFDGGILANN